MRAYFFRLMYLTGIHSGIQSGHAAEEMWSYYVEGHFAGTLTHKEKIEFSLLRIFAKEHKTWIILNGGEYDDLVNLLEFFDLPENPYPHSVFYEPGMGGTLTAIRIIVPEGLYDDVSTAVGKALLKGDPLSQNWPALEIALNCADRKYNPWEREFLKRKAMCGLAS